jgi:hypothetical protein
MMRCVALSSMMLCEPAARRLGSSIIKTASSKKNDALYFVKYLQERVTKTHA